VPGQQSALFGNSRITASLLAAPILLCIRLDRESLAKFFFQQLTPGRLLRYANLPKMTYMATSPLTTPPARIVRTIAAPKRMTTGSGE
jgi:hypothetical protein